MKLGCFVLRGGCALEPDLGVGGGAGGLRMFALALKFLESHLVDGHHTLRLIQPSF